MKNGNGGERPAAWRPAGSAQSFRQACRLNGSESRDGFDFGPLSVETLARGLPKPRVLSLQSGWTGIGRDYAQHGWQLCVVSAVLAG